MSEEQKRLEAVLSCNLNGAICVEQGGGMAKEDKTGEAQQDYYIQELIRDVTGLRAVLIGEDGKGGTICDIKDQLKDMAREQKELLKTLTQLTLEMRSGQNRTDSRIDKLEDGHTSLHARVDEVEKRVACNEGAIENLRNAPGGTALRALKWAGGIIGFALIMFLLAALGEGIVSQIAERLVWLLVQGAV